jgi:hypothetical protein
MPADQFPATFQFPSVNPVSSQVEVIAVASAGTEIEARKISVVKRLNPGALRRLIANVAARALNDANERQIDPSWDGKNGKGIWNAL